MSDLDLIELFFGGMEKAGPGGNADTLQVLDRLPVKDFRLVVDAGCGPGRQTVALAKAIGTVIHAVDLHEPFLNDLALRAKESGLEHLVQPHCMDMNDIPATFREIDLLWAEGSAYSIGFGNALKRWAPSIAAGGFLAVSELSWISEQIPERVSSFFQSGYPDMKSIDRNIELCRNAGYSLLGTHTVPRETWIKGYYDILGPRAKALEDHADASVREFAAETLEEIDIFEISQDCYGYVFFLLQRT